MKIAVVDSNCLNLRLPEVEAVVRLLVNDPNVMFVFPDVILGEQAASDAWRNIFAANFSPWASLRDRVLPGRHFSELLDLEMARRAPVKRSEIIHREKAGSLREFILDSGNGLDAYSDGLDAAREESRISGVMNRQSALEYYRGHASQALNGLRRARQVHQSLWQRPNAGVILDNAAMVGCARGSVASDLVQHHGWTEPQAIRFSGRDTYRFRTALSFAVRAQMVGDQIGKRTAPNHLIDCDYCTLASYGDIQLTRDVQCMEQLERMKSCIEIQRQQR
jgi:hypothetical protein